MMLLRDENSKSQTEARGKGKKYNLVLSVVFVIALGIFIYSSYQIISYFVEENEQKSITESLIEEGIQKIPLTQLEEETPTSSSVSLSHSTSSATVTTTKKPRTILTRPDISVDFSKLTGNYPRLIGWLYGQDETVHNPVMQWDDNDYYLNHLPNGATNAAGSLFMDFRDPADFSGWNHIIYGHNMKNGSMFGFLHDYRKEGYFEENPYLFYFTSDRTYRLELFAGIHTTNDSFVYSHPVIEEDRLIYLNQVKKRSVFTANVSVSASDSIVVLSTCSGALDSPDRFVVLAKLVALS